ncbi:MAG: hypothetical protein F6J93_27675 [Oscillatoria sp. SIO1A7]|nr:hypothetical protein [Oscillatoria sp. SIO1A7]
MNQRRRIKVFGSGVKDSIMVPQTPIIARNNCKIGKWTINSKEYQGRNQIAILKVSKLFGSFGETKNTLWGQVWFVCEEGSLPKQVVLVTYLKKRSLLSLLEIMTLIRLNKAEPASGIFSPIFVSQSASKSRRRYYVLEWEWEGLPGRERQLERYAKVLANESKLMIEPTWTRNMICLDGMSSWKAEMAVSDFIKKNK